MARVGRTRALVLGGGGVTGIAWEAGVLHGLADGGVDIRAWDAVIGTSAGAIVGARLLGDPEFAAFVASQQVDDTTAEDRLARELVGRIGALALVTSRRPRLGWLLDLWAGTALVRSVIGRWIPRGRGAGSALAVPPRRWSPARRPSRSLARYGSLGIAAPAGPEAAFREAIAGILDPVRDWPDGLRVPAIDALDGALVVFDSASGVAVAEAVAASAALPVLFPPITIEGRPYIDGGMGSDTNATLAAGYDEVLILAPLDRTVVAPELPALEKAGSRVALIQPGAAAAAAIGSRVSLLDPARRAVSVREGYEDGRSAAPRVLATWRGEVQHGATAA